MKASTKIVAAAIHISLLLIVSVIFADFGKTQIRHQFYRNPKGDFARRRNLMNTLDNKQLLSVMGARLAHLKEMENTIKSVYFTESELKEALEAPDTDNQRIKDLLGDIHLLEISLNKLVFKGNQNIREIFPDLDSAFIGRGPIIDAWKLNN